MVANRTHSQGQSAALRTCRMCKMFRSEAGAKKKKSRPIVHFSVFPEGVSRFCAVGAWGTAGDSGWKGVFQLDAFHGCFGKRWWKPGEVKLPVPPPGVLAVSEQTKKERQSELVAAQNVFSLLLGMNLSENKPPSEFGHSAAPASTQHDSAASEQSHWESSHVAKGGRKREEWAWQMQSCEATRRLIFTFPIQQRYLFRYLVGFWFVCFRYLFKWQLSRNANKLHVKHITHVC